MPKLSPEEYTFVAEILSGTTVEKAGDIVGIKKRTAFQWKAKPHIQEALKAGKNGEIKVIEEFRAERLRVVLPEISGILREQAPRAIAIIIDIMETGKKDDIVRLQAAREILKLSGVVESQKFVQNTEQIMKEKGLSSDRAAEIRAKILGISASLEAEPVPDLDYGDGVKSDSDDDVSTIDVEASLAEEV